mmetsp:Transcript_30716/g.65025  ORF Transcript_30716/g.65025 Transcript_30716/m.65025 type:complete len:101 (-) Transcript_30716:18-320(-)
MPPPHVEAKATYQMGVEVGESADLYLAPSHPMLLGSSCLRGSSLDHHHHIVFNWSFFFFLFAFPSLEQTQLSPQSLATWTFCAMCMRVCQSTLPSNMNEG